ncbi:MAG: hypothetical protein NFCOHLIN_01841 [Gammaproteobacteria bacterium]|nr:hypothetical protein [Gammaproteobacteria bacterium]
MSGAEIVQRSLYRFVSLALMGVAMHAHAKIDQASIVVDVDRGTVVLEDDATHLWYPASLTKMMTVYLAFEAIEAGTLAFTDVLVASRHVAAQPDSRIGLDTGEKMTVREAILAVIAQSTNDAAVLLAERIAGSEEDFARVMTARARDLGMSRTVFRNASGLPHDEQKTTARDMAILAMSLMRDFPQHYELFNTRSFTYKGITYGNINGILSSYPGADGLKTGFTCGSGYNLVASAKRDDHRLVGVLLGAGSGSERTAAMTKLLNEGFAKLRVSGSPLMLASLEPAPAVAAEPPPFRLKASECAIGAGISGRARRLPGWGLLFGAFNEASQAHRHAELMRKRLQPTLRGGQVAVVPRQVEDVKTYKALLVGLKQVDAVNACLQLIKSDNVCLVQSPTVLNGSGVLGERSKKRVSKAAAAAAPPPYLP